MESIPTKNPSILVVDDDPGLLTSVRATLLSAGQPEPALLSDPLQALPLVRRYRFPLVMLDLMMPGKDGLTVLQELKSEYPDTECIIVTAVDDIDAAVTAIRYGAYDYLVKPLEAEKLLISVDRALERYHLRRERFIRTEPVRFEDLRHPEAFDGMVAEDPAMARVFNQAETSASSDYSVLLTGETGTGKEMLARVIHRISNRSQGPFFGVSMAALSQPLVEDELFGHEKGAYTGALSSKKGFFESAHRGTLFLDEITELPLNVQATLLRVLQERELYRIGSTEAQKIDVRILTACNLDILDAVRNGTFRNDLYYRLNTLRIHIPPLRERPGDILPLARHFIRIHARRIGKDIRSLSRGLAESLQAYSFPGNVRELENLIASGCVQESTRMLRSRSVPLPRISIAYGEDDSRIPSLKEIERAHIRRVLDAVQGNRTQAAAILGIGLRTLQRKLKKNAPSVSPS